MPFPIYSICIFHQASGWKCGIHMQRCTPCTLWYLLLWRISRFSPAVSAQNVRIISWVYLSISYKSISTFLCDLLKQLCRKNTQIITRRPTKHHECMQPSIFLRLLWTAGGASASRLICSQLHSSLDKKLFYCESWILNLILEWWIWVWLLEIDWLIEYGLMSMKPSKDYTRLHHLNIIVS